MECQLVQMYVGDMRQVTIDYGGFGEIADGDSVLSVTQLLVDSEGLEVSDNGVSSNVATIAIDATDAEPGMSYHIQVTVATAASNLLTETATVDVIGFVEVVEVVP